MSEEQQRNKFRRTQRNFDPSKLKILFEELVPVTETTSLVGRVYSYDNSPKRLKVLSRLFKKDGTQKTIKEFPPLTNSEQIKKLEELIAKCAGHMKDWKGLNE